MQYSINTKNIKQSVQNMASFFKEKDIDIPRNILFDAFSKALFFKNWNTLSGMTSKAEIIKHIPEKRIYLIEIECSLELSQLKALVLKSFIDGKCTANIDNIIHSDNVTHMEISFPNKSDNFLTSMIFMVQAMQNYEVKRFDLMRITQEKESLMSALEIR